MLKSRRYRNRRLGDFLKELDLTEGRSTGVPTIQAKLAENGSPRAIFETTDDRLTFLVTIPVHKGCEQRSLHGKAAKPSAEKSSGTSSRPDSGANTKSSEKGVLGSKKSSEKTSKSSEKILDLIKNKPTISAAEIAMEIDMSARGVEKQIRKLREAGIIKRIGADRGGYWEITVTKEDK